MFFFSTNSYSALSLQNTQGKDYFRFEMHSMMEDDIKRGLPTRVVYGLFCLGCLLCLYQVWSPAHFLTTDGPCHVYNAGILRDLFLKRYDGFYESLYMVNKQINANWFSHVILAGLLCIVKGAVAEKILITFYMLLLISGAMKLMQLVHKNPMVFVLGIFLFLFNLPLMKGFYNFCFSVALFPWLLWAFLRFFQQVSLTRFLLAFLISFLSFLAHPAGYMISVMFAFFLLLSTHVASQKNLSKFLKNVFLYACIQMPLLGIIWQFNQVNRSAHFRLFFNRAFLSTYFIRFTSFQCVTEKELYYGIACAVLLLLFFAGLLMVRIRTKKLVEPNDGFLYGLGLIMLLYLFFPDNFPVELMELRLQFIVYLTIFLWITTTCQHRIFSWLLSLSLFSIFCILTFFRVPVIQRIDQGLQEVLTVGNRIPPYSTLLMLNFSHHGKDTGGNLLNEKEGVFLHAHQYLSETKPLLMLDNYEANTGYFPLTYHDTLNPYKSLCNGLNPNNLISRLKSMNEWQTRTLIISGTFFLIQPYCVIRVLPIQTGRFCNSIQKCIAHPTAWLFYIKENLILCKIGDDMLLEQ
ncbi:hypothetical protein EMGBS15_16870, partial [Filimonas sp.]